MAVNQSEASINITRRPVKPKSDKDWKYMKDFLAMNENIINKEWNVLPWWYHLWLQGSISQPAADSIASVKNHERRVRRETKSVRLAES